MIRGQGGGMNGERVICRGMNGSKGIVMRMMYWGTRGLDSGWGHVSISLRASSSPGVREHVRNVQTPCGDDRGLQGLWRGNLWLLTPWEERRTGFGEEGCENLRQTQEEGAGLTYIGLRGALNDWGTGVWTSMAQVVGLVRKRVAWSCSWTFVIITLI